ncbi:MAG TPA: hypothetical protein VFF00_04640 [Candidatus Elarobacter sp.]|nr:hypothetical protein [Dongiaceae bacterium]HZW53298.1 hypothetical protein [Candidatus Elarobacter sp.]
MRFPALAALAVLATASAAFAATPAPKPAPPQRIDVIKAQPKELAPKRPLHVEYTVEVNRLGQVARVRTVKPSHDEAFDAHTYGNALQAFIRTPDGEVVLGTYRLSYDYDPKTLRVRRDVTLVKRGGVDPNAKGAATSMMEIARRNRNKTPPPVVAVTPGPVPSVNIKRMPDLPQVMKSPSPAH